MYIHHGEEVDKSTGRDSSTTSMLQETSNDVNDSVNSSSYFISYPSVTIYHAGLLHVPTTLGPPSNEGPDLRESPSLPTHICVTSPYQLPHSLSIYTDAPPGPVFQGHEYIPSDLGHSADAQWIINKSLAIPTTSAGLPLTLSANTPDLSSAGNEQPQPHSGSTIVQSSDNYTDSGYASRGSVKRRGPHQKIQRMSLQPTPAAHLSDSKTIYSDNSSIADMSHNIYISELAEEIAAVLPLWDTPVHHLTSLSTALPDLLKAFAIMISREFPGELHQRLKCFVYRSRREISDAVIKTFVVDDESSYNELNNATGTDNMSLEDKLRLWQSNENRPLTYDPVDRLPWDDGLATDDDFEDFAGLREYRTTLQRSQSFEWLLQSVLVEVNMHIPEDKNAKSEIRKKIISHLGEPVRISRKEITVDHQMRFLAPWIAEFLASEDYDLLPHEALSRVLVMTGVGCHAWATTCLEYVQTVWPKTGPRVLGLYIDLLRPSSLGSTSRCILSDNTVLLAQVTSNGKSIAVDAIGSAYSIAEAGEVMAWLSAAVGSSPVDRTISYHYPSCEIRDFWRPLPLAATSTKINKICVIENRSGDPLYNPWGPTDKRGECWFLLFRNPAMVEGYPVPRRPEPNTGMEMSLDTIALLANVRKLSNFGGRLMLKGFSTILIPTGSDDGVVYWHAVHNEDGEYISYCDPKAKEAARKYPKALSVGDLESSRHILGWCANVNNMTGARGANYNIGWSGLMQPPPGCAFEKVSIVGGMFITAGMSCILGKKDKAVHIRTRDDYTMRLKWVHKKHVVLYDTKERRAWMVDGVSALLHLVRASLKHDQADSFNDLFLYNDFSLQESPAAGTGKSASINVLTNKQNLNLPLYAKPDDMKEEVSINAESGTQSRVLSRTRRDYCFRDRVESICDVLEQIIAHQADVSTEDGVGFRVKTTLRRQLEGFDFMDVATDEDPIWPRVTTLRATGRGWVDFTRAIHAVTLFGSGFGDLIRPVSDAGTAKACGVCQLNTDVPKGQDYLTVCVPELQDILQKRGTRVTNPWRLVDNIYWHAPDKTFDPCRCGKLSILAKTKDDRVQVLLPSSFPKLLRGGFKSPPDLASTPRGALLFGHSSRFPLWWKDRGPPKEGQPEDFEMEDMEGAFNDSGIGSSLGPSSAGGASSDDSSSASANVHSPSPIREIAGLGKRGVDSDEDERLEAKRQKSTVESHTGLGFTEMLDEDMVQIDGRDNVGKTWEARFDGFLNNVGNWNRKGKGKERAI
ncbi:hypothetical protein B0T17DRAFT_305457 [Bombardia bombarda]|uniref:Uncharacterized protein n=1 Tax=Bombardia bombarda TaxID=252184 RepID=A0AA39WUR6_9PEZI|nr:hypothetical protein B0T17DRAFT_305457 [Bombardia bombarda]